MKYSINTLEAPKAVMLRVFGTIILTLALLLGGGMVGENPARAACGDPPAPDVDWSGCDKRGADLAGANLQRANLRQVDFSGADLSEANLWRAELSGAILKETILAGTSWWEGTICSDQSVSKCWEVHTGGP